MKRAHLRLRATVLLDAEHRWIEALLECLTRVVDPSRAGHAIAPVAGELLTLFETFADGTHQSKEERVLFPRLMERSSIAEGDLIRDLLYEHFEDRRCMRGLQMNLLGAMYGEPACVREFVGQAAAYVKLHRLHIQREEEELLPLADRLLTDADDRAVVAAFDTVELHGTLDREHLGRRITTLCVGLGVSVSAWIDEETA